LVVIPLALNSTFIHAYPRFILFISINNTITNKHVYCFKQIFSLF
jgi:hypothetical protein